MRPVSPGFVLELEPLGLGLLDLLLAVGVVGDSHSHEVRGVVDSLAALLHHLLAMDLVDVEVQLALSVEHCEEVCKTLFLFAHEVAPLEVALQLLVVLIHCIGVADFAQVAAVVAQLDVLSEFLEVEESFFAELTIGMIDENIFIFVCISIVEMYVELLFVIEGLFSEQYGPMLTAEITTETMSTTDTSGASLSCASYTAGRRHEDGPPCSCRKGTAWKSSSGRASVASGLGSILSPSNTVLTSLYSTHWSRS